MTQITLNISNPASARAIRAIARLLDGVSVQKTRKIPTENRLDIAIREAETGKVTTWESPDALIEHIKSL